VLRFGVVLVVRFAMAASVRKLLVCILGIGVCSAQADCLLSILSSNAFHAQNLSNF
jgi:hypothetical protein